VFESKKHLETAREGKRGFAMFCPQLGSQGEGDVASGFSVLDPDQTPITEDASRQATADELPDLIQMVEIRQFSRPIGAFFFFHENLVAHHEPQEKRPATPTADTWLANSAQLLANAGE
jgi:hypothetical protein